MSNARTASAANTNAPATYTLKGSKKRKGWRWLAGASRLGLHSSVAAVSLLTLTAPNVLHAQDSGENAFAVGDTIADPATGEALRVLAAFEGAVLVEGNVLVLTDPSVGADVPDPANGANFVAVTGVSTNPATGLVEQVTLADGRVIDVARDVAAQIFPEAAADPLASLVPLPPANENRNTVSSTSLNGSNGADGDSNIITAQDKNGDSGGTRGAFSATYNQDIEAIGDTFTVPVPPFITIPIRIEGIDIRGRGGNGGDGSNGTVLIGTSGGNGGNGATGTRLTVANSGTISTNDPGGTFGIYVRSSGGTGGDAGDGAFGIASKGGNGGRGGSGGTVSVTNNASGNITTRRGSAHGMYGVSLGASGGDGGDGGTSVVSDAGSAGRAGNGGGVSITNRGEVYTLGSSAHGIVAQSVGGSGGDGGDANGFFAYSGSGSGGGSAGSVILSNLGLISTSGADSHGIVGQGIGGGGGASGNSFGFVALGGSAGSGNNGGTSDLTNFAGGTIVTQGARSFGMLSQSIGGGGGSAGISGGLIAVGGSGSAGGNGGNALGLNFGLIATFGQGGHGIVTQSIGGGGGAGSTAGGAISIGGRGGAGGSGGFSETQNFGTIITEGFGAHGALVQSIGGGGGNGGIAGGAISVGGRGSNGGSSAQARFVNGGFIQTSGSGSFGALVQSIGGGGGNGATAGGLISVGGAGSTGGNAGEAEINNSGDIVTSGALSHAIVAQSVGGGGGNGGLAASVSAFVGVAIGGSGSAGGNGGTVDINFSNRSETIDGVTRSLTPVISTSGDLSSGILAQSVGGGGGNGGSAYQGTLGAFGAVSVAVGGAGSAGGRGGTIDIDGDATVLTQGNFSHGFLAQSVGGGGGNGGGAVAVSGSVGAGGSLSVSVGVGGSGGTGGNGGLVDIDSGGFIGTSGAFSHGLLAQSVGGGGGNGGFTVTAAGAASDGVGVSIPVGVGGSGGNGGDGRLVDIDYLGDIRTQGAFSHGLLAQSVGGAGGNGGFSVNVAVSGGGGGAGGIAIGVGGTGGGGGDGGSSLDTFRGVDASLTGNILTEGEFSNGFLAQSVGGSGGNGGYNVSAGVTISGGASGSLAVGVGGSGGGAGSGRGVDANVDGDIGTMGNFADAFVAQSVGGGGGNGGVNVSGTIALSSTAAAGINVGVGGAGGGGGAGGTVDATVNGTLATVGTASDGALVQSLGGGGGNGAVNVSAGLTASSNGGTIGVGVGGAGGGAGNALAATLIRTGNTSTQGDEATGIVVQSQGGGGGNGGVNVTAGVTLTSGASATVGVGVGGFGGSGGRGGEATLTLSGDTSTAGDDAAAIVTQSLGGGGGNGGVNVTGGLTGTAGTGGTLGVGIGGFGGGGGGSQLAVATIDGNTGTSGANSGAVLVQSLAGGGGNGGVNVTAGVALTAGSAGTIGVGIGGFGGSGGASGEARLSLTGDTMTTGEDSVAIATQSLGGGGGNGGLNVTGGLTASTGTSGGLSVGIGGFGGSGGAAGLADAMIDGMVATTGENSTAVLVQSLGGGGGNGGVNITGGITGSTASAFGGAFGLGGFGGGGEDGATARLSLEGAVSTSGAQSDAVVIQSIGGGGGRGGLNIAGGLTLTGTGTSIAAAVGLGGFGGEAGDGGLVDVQIAASVAALGIASDETIGTGDEAQRSRLGGSHGILAQSVGGGGGAGGTNITAGIGLSSNLDGGSALSLGVGGYGGDGGNAGRVQLTTTGAFVTGTGDDKSAVLAQSVGGSGGDGGLNIAGGIAVDGSVTVGVGGFGGAGGTGGIVDAHVSSNLNASGARASGLLAQSVGGGGGNGGTNITGGISAGNRMSLPAVTFAIGGGGGAGNAADRVDADVDGETRVSGVGSSGLIAQSVGGGGGEGGLTISAAVGTSSKFNLGVALGGGGGAGADGGVVDFESDGLVLVDARGLVDAQGIASDFSGGGSGIIAQSIGGGGGNGGLSVAGAGTNEGVPLSIGIGGSGGPGGAGGAVSLKRGLTQTGLVQVWGNNSVGLLAQSVGGGGGNGGGTIVLNASLRAAYDVQLNIGGAGGLGADGGVVTVDHRGEIVTTGEMSNALLAQSIGGGGGNAGYTINGSLIGGQTRTDGTDGTRAFDLTIGGGTGVGSDGQLVDVTHDGMLTTSGDFSTALLAQSIGGGGGNAGSAFSENFNDESAVSVTFGRIGGIGGLGGMVDVETSGMIMTSGLRSHGVHAQSIGGGGGTSSTTSINAGGDLGGDDEGGRKASLSLELAFGLEGGEGSRADRVDVLNSGTIITTGLDAHGIYAQSIGGGGGSGGAAIIDLRQEVLELLEPASFDDSENVGIALAYQAGGKGGSAAEGREVAVTNTGNVMTEGEGANAIRAQSIGGGGGDGGSAFNLAAPGKDDSIGLEIASGGEGGTGAIGGLVTVANLGGLGTKGDDAAAVFAQSIGGGGGNGGLAGNLTIANAETGNHSLTLTWNVGGKGGLGGAAGDVIVSNGSAEDTSALIMTEGERSYGIHAQSIGGGGGNGGMAISGNYASAPNNIQLGLSFGGDGEMGGVGGMATVDNFGSIVTTGDEAHGIFAQSIGGGGGNGALSLVGSVTRAATLAPNQAIVAIGGSGGMGNDAGDVIVNNSGLIQTSGDDAHGIFAQSLGGGGGNMSLGLTATNNKPVNYIANAAALILGARPGEGGEGGEVTVNHTGEILVTGDGARGVVAESINGGGGGIALDISGLAGFLTGELIPGEVVPDDVEDNLAEFSAGIPVLSVFGGAAGQGDANAEKVTLNLTGSIGVAGDFGAALNQQSIGGGGGRIDLDLNLAELDAGAGSALGFEMMLGGSDGSGNAGGDIQSVHGGNVITQGERTTGVFLQSIGGGGARATTLFSGEQARLGEMVLRLGGMDQTSSTGGAISHTQTGSIATSGNGAAGAIVQNIGGGGGLMTFAFIEVEDVLTDDDAGVSVQSITTAAVTPTPVMAVDGTLTLGADGGAGLDGASVDYAMTGDVMTSGDLAIGLVLQSIGAGGGYADLGNLSGVDIVIGGSNGAQGNGGAVALTMDGNTSTTGAGSHALVLQSIGGGGGVVIGDAPDGNVTLSDANSGDGGALSLALTGNVVTEGAGANAIVLQSLGGGGGIVGGELFAPAGGTGSGGAITLTIDGTVASTGDNASAIVAQSAGNLEGSAGGGDISITIADGGAVMAAGDNSALVLLGGADNTVTNNGMLAAMTGLAGTAMTGTSGNDTLINNGVLVGAVALGGGANALSNGEDGQFFSSSTLDLGAPANTFTNAGFLAPGDTNSIVQTVLSGSFVQTETGSTFTELDLAAQTFDAINATGSVNVDGAVDLILLNKIQFTPGLFSAPIFTGDAGATLGNVDLRADSSVVLNLLGISQSGNAVQVDYDLTFAPVEALGNRAELGQYLDRVQAEGVSASLQPTFTQLIGVQDVGVYIDLLTQLSGDIYAEQNVHSLQNHQRFADRIGSCGTLIEGQRVETKRTCAWIEGNLADSSLSAHNGTPAMDSETTSVSAGMVHTLNDAWSIAFGLDYSDYDLTGYGGAWTSSGNGFQLGAGIRRDFGNSQIGLYAAYGSADYDTMRELAGFGGTATGARKLDVFSSQLVGSHTFDLGNFAVVPSLALGVAKLGSGKREEANTTANALTVETVNATHAWAMPGLELAYDVPVSEEWTLKPFLAGSLRYYLTDSVVEVMGRFSEDSSNVMPFIAGVPLGKSELSGEAGLEISGASGFTLGASYQLQSSSERDADIISVRLSYPF